MAKRGRVVVGSIAFVLIVLLTIVLLSYHLLTKSLPKTNGTVFLDTLTAKVHVYRDDYGVPHILAENETDLFIAAGYVTAQDRLWQMDLNRRVALGKLSEIFGESTLESDKFIRTWGFNRIASAIANSLSTESRRALQAYADGINAFIESHRDRLPLEFSVLGYEPDPWRIEDSIAFTRLMAWRLSFSWYVDMVLHQLVQKLGERKAREVFPDFPRDAPLIITSRAKSVPASVEDFLNAGLSLREFLGIDGAQLGSNSWVVSGEQSVCGKPLLANDPHLELTTPSVWYEIHLASDSLNVAGVSLPGAPAVVIGHNDRIAWGLTNGMVDDVDFYFEKVNAADPEQYWSGTEWTEFEVMKEEILIKDARPVSLTISATRNGPVISKIHPVLKERAEVVSIRWVGSQPSDELAAFLKIQRAGNWTDFTTALRDWRVPAQNFLFASVDGDIGYYLGGAIPIRRNANGILPHQGWSVTGQWVDFVPFEKLPHLHNPPENRIVTANNKIVDDRYPYYITNLWEPPGRAARIHELLATKEKFEIEDFKAIQMDVTSLQAQRILPKLLSAVGSRLDANAGGDLRMLFDLIKDWDGKESEESVPAAIFHGFFIKLIENTFKDEMGDELYGSYVRLASVPSRVISALVEKGSSKWFDNVLTPEVETGKDILVKSLQDAATSLREIAGENISDWAWGRVHQLTMSHSLGRRKPLDTLLNLGPYPRSGSNVTVNNSQYRLNRPFDAFVGPSTRQLVDLCNITRSLSVITSGQSGQRMSDHYKDQTPLWLEGKYHPLIMDKNEIVETAKSHLVLQPKRSSTAEE